jgi:hypothetical protein
MLNGENVNKNYLQDFSFSSINKSLKKFINLISHPYKRVVNTNFFNRIFSWRPHIDPLTNKTIESLKPRIQALDKKIENLNHAFDTENMKGVLTPYEVLLVLRCLEFRLLHDNPPIHLNEFLENLKNHNLLKPGFENIDRKEINALINYKTKKNLCFPIVNTEFIDIRLLSSNFNHDTPQISFSREEWEFLTILTSMDSDINSEKYLRFFERLPLKFADHKFLEKVENFLSMEGFNLLSIDKHLYSRLEIETGNIYNGKEILSFIKRISEEAELDYDELCKFSFCIEHFFYVSEFPTLEEASKAGLPQNSLAILQKMRKINDDIALIPLIRFFGKLSNLEESIEKLKELPACMLDWTGGQIEFAYNTSAALSSLFQSEEWISMENASIRIEVKELSRLALKELNKFAELMQNKSESSSEESEWEELEVATQHPLIKKMIHLKNQLGDRLVAFSEADRSMPLNCSHLSEFPLRKIFKKIEHLNLLHHENRLKDINCNDKLTLNEYLWIKIVFRSFIVYFSQKELETLNYFMNSTKMQSRINICMVSSKKILLNYIAEKKMTSAQEMPKWKLTILRICNWLDSKILNNVHANFLILNQNEYSHYGLGDGGYYQGSDSGNFSPNMDTYQVNVLKLGQKLNVPSEKLKEFEMLFESKLLSVIESQKNVRIAKPFVKVFNSIFSIAPFIKPQNFKLDQKKEYLCSEFVYRNFVQAACETLEELKLPLPKNMKSFGLGYFSKREGITPDQVMKALIGKGFITENKHFSQFVNI